MKKKILIIGGEGYIGQIVCKRFIDEQYSVTSLDNLIYKQKNNVSIINSADYTFMQSDLRDFHKLNIKEDNYYGLIILGGLVGDPITKKYPEISYEINYKGIKNIIDRSIKENIQRIIFISTCSNYGLIKENERADENFQLNPLSAYAKAKVDIEKYILSLKQKTNSCITIFRFATAYGLSTRMRYDLTVNEFSRDIFNQKKLEVYDPDTWRPYCHVNDFADILLLAIEKEKSKIAFEVFNAGSDENNFTKRMIVDKILKHKNSDYVEFISKKGSDPRNYRVNFEKLNSVFNYKCKHSVEDGIKEILKHLDNLKKNNFDTEEILGNYRID